MATSEGWCGVCVCVCVHVLYGPRYFLTFALSEAGSLPVQIGTVGEMRWSRGGEKEGGRGETCERNKMRKRGMRRYCGSRLAA